MKIKGVIKDELKEFLEKSYNLGILDISYFPKGEDGAGYIIKTANQKYFSKVYNKGKKAFKSIRVIKSIIEFLFVINEKYNFHHTPLPIKNKNKNVISKFNGFPVVLYDYISGGNLKKLKDSDYSQMGEILSKIHSFDKLKFPKIKKEDLSLKWESKILKFIDILKKKESIKGSSIDILKNIILDKEKELKEALKFLKKKVKYVKNKINEYVLVHSDLHSGNLMKDKSSIYIIDWDGLELALKEKDLMWFCTNSKINSKFEKEYEKDKIDLEALKFYIIRRVLSDLVFFTNTILYREYTLKENRERLGIVKYSINALIKNIK